jgi:hypothetical protein
MPAHSSGQETWVRCGCACSLLPRILTADNQFHGTEALLATESDTQLRQLDQCSMLFQYYHPSEAKIRHIHAAFRCCTQEPKAQQLMGSPAPASAAPPAMLGAQQCISGAVQFPHYLRLARRSVLSGLTSMDEHLEALFCKQHGPSDDDATRVVTDAAVLQYTAADGSTSITTETVRPGIHHAYTSTHAQLSVAATQAPVMAEDVTW